MHTVPWKVTKVMLIEAYLLADLFQMYDMGGNEIFKQFEKEKNKTKQTYNKPFRIRTIMRHFKLIQFKKVWFLHCSSTQSCCPMAIWGCCISVSEECPGVQSVNTRICTMDVILGWIWVFLTPALAQPAQLWIWSSTTKLCISVIQHLLKWATSSQ